MKSSLTYLSFIYSHLSCTLCFRDREDLVNLINQLSSGEELLGLELLNEDSNSQESEKPIIDTGQVEMTTSEENSIDNISSNNVKIENNNQQENSLNAVSVSQNSLTVQENVDSIETTIKTVRKEQIVLVKRETNLTNLDKSKVFEETKNPCDKNNELVGDNDLKISVQSEGRKTPLDEATYNLDKNVTQQNFSNSENISLYSAKMTNDIVSIPAQTVAINKTDCSLPSQISEPNPSETSKLNVAEEIKQRSLCKSGISQSLFNGKSNKPTSGSKLDLIFSRKLEQSTSGSPTDKNSKSLPKVFTSLSETLEDTNVEDGKYISNESIDLSSSHNNELAQPCSVSSESNSKRKPDEPVEQPSKKKCLEVEHNEVGEEIEEPVMIIRGEGSGEDCDTGNPGTDSGENITTKENLSKKSCSSETVNSGKENTSCSEGVSLLESCNDSQEINNSLVANSSSEFDKSIEEQLSAITGESLSPKQNEEHDISMDILEESNSLMTNTNADKGENLSGDDNHSKNTAPPESEKTEICNDSIDIFGTEESTASPIVEKESNEENKQDQNSQLNNVKGLSKNDQDADYSINENISVASKINVNLTENSALKQTTDQNKRNNSCKIDKQISGNSQNKNVHVISDVQIDSPSVNIGSIDKTINDSNDISENLTSNEALCKTNLENDSKKTECNTSLNSKLDCVPSLLLHDKETSEEIFGKQTETNISSNSKEPNIDTKKTDLGDDSKDKIKLHDNNIDVAREEGSILLVESVRINQSDSKDLAVQKEVSSKIIDSEKNQINNELSDTSPEKDLTNTGNKQSSSKKLPKRKKLFSPRSKKRTKKGQRISCANETSNEKNKETMDKNYEKIAEAKGEREDLKCTKKEEQTETNKKNKLSLKVETKPAEINRKRRNSRKNTGTEKDSEDDNVSERNEEDEEVGGKRRKMKGELFCLNLGLVLNPLKQFDILWININMLVYLVDCTLVVYVIYLKLVEIAVHFIF